MKLSIAKAFIVFLLSTYHLEPSFGQENQVFFDLTILSLNLSFSELNENLAEFGYLGVAEELIGVSYKAGFSFKRDRSISCHLKFLRFSSIETAIPGREYTLLKGRYYGAGISRVFYLGKFQLTGEANGFLSQYLATAKKELTNSSPSVQSLDVDKWGHVIEPNISVYYDIGKAERLLIGLTGGYFYQTHSTNWLARFRTSTVFVNDSPSNKENFSLGFAVKYILNIKN